MIADGMVDLGKKFVALGLALQDQDTTISELTGLAFDCHLRLEFRLSQKPLATSPEPTNLKHGEKNDG